MAYLKYNTGDYNGQEQERIPPSKGPRLTIYHGEHGWEYKA